MCKIKVNSYRIDSLFLFYNKRGTADFCAVSFNRNLDASHITDSGVLVYCCIDVQKNLKERRKKKNNKRKREDDDRLAASNRLFVVGENDDGIYS